MSDGAGARLAQQMQFVAELDKLKRVMRQTLLAGGTRAENSAEHSWHVAVMTWMLAEYAPQPLDVQRAMAMAVLHDVIEIEAGDSFCYDVAAMRTKEEREARAAARLFALLPADQAGEARGVWEEFEAGRTNEARYVGALDRLQPLVQNYLSGGGSWKRHGITVEQIVERCAPIGEACPALWEYAQRMIDEARERGYMCGAAGVSDAGEPEGGAMRAEMADGKGG